MSTTRLRFLTLVAIFALVMSGLPGQAAIAAAATRLAPSIGTTSSAVAPDGAEGIQPDEIDSAMEFESGSPTVNRARPGFKNGKFPKTPLDVPAVDSSVVAGSNPELGLSVAGMNHRNQRLANGGNQFSLEPPDQGLCAGNGRVIEAINDVIKIFDTSGGTVAGITDLNTFYGYPAAINRTTGVRGPELTDPVCLYDAGINRFVVAELTLDRISAADPRLSGVNHLDIAVSPDGSPTSLSGWKIYRIDVTDDGTGGTPNHGCNFTGTPLTGRHENAAIGDYPHIGADANGIYLSTNEYCFFADGYNGAQIYAIGKRQLAGTTLPSALKFVHVENASVDGSPGFTVWPATSLPGHNSAERNGTEYFLSSIAGDGSETGNPTGTARRIGIWGLTNTASLNTSSPAISLSSRLINSQTYVLAGGASQKAGSIPLADCVNNTTMATPFGPGCWQFLLNPPEPAHDEVESKPDSLDTRMQQVFFVNGTLWSALGTAVNVGGKTQTGIAWFAVDPKINGAGKVEGKIRAQGYLALAGNNLTMPAVAMLPSGRGVMAFTVLGDDFFPSAGYVTLTESGPGPIHIASAGLGPDDGFTSYKAFVGNPPRTRWGDYGAAVVLGSDIWIGSEYIAQTCTFAQYTATPFGSCGGTRTSLGNWATRISKVTP